MDTRNRNVYAGDPHAEDKRAIKRLIRRYTDKRDWEMVRALLVDLGEILEESETLISEPRKNSMIRVPTQG